MTWLDMSKGPCIQTRKDENVFVVGLETIYEKSTSGFFHLGHFLSLNQIKRCSLFSHCPNLSMGKHCVQGRLEENLWYSIRTVKCTDSSHLMNSSLRLLVCVFSLLPPHL